PAGPGGPAAARAELDVVLRREVDRARRAPARLLVVLRVVRALRHRRVGKVGDAARDRVERGTDLGQARLRGLQLLAEARDLGQQRRHVLAARLRLADRLAAGVAQVLQFLRAHLDVLAFRFQRLQRGDVQRESAARAQARGGVGEVGAEQRGIEHGQVTEDGGGGISACLCGPLPRGRAGPCQNAANTEPEPAMPAPAPETDPPARAPRRDRRGRPDWLPSRTALLVAAIAFGAGLLLFAALWLDQRNDNDFFKADGVPRSIEGQ